MSRVRTLVAVFGVAGLLIICGCKAKTKEPPKEKPPVVQQMEIVPDNSDSTESDDPEK